MQGTKITRSACSQYGGATVSNLSLWLLIIVFVGTSQILMALPPAMASVAPSDDQAKPAISWCTLQNLCSLGDDVGPVTCHRSTRPSAEPAARMGSFGCQARPTTLSLAWYLCTNCR